MKGILNGLLVAFSMYSAIPVPQVKWEKGTLRWALCFFPFIGALIGALEWIWRGECRTHGVSAIFYAVTAALIPLAISGGIHLDGLCDACDALCSFGDRDKRLAILKDAHIGAFGAIWLIAFIMTETACFAQIYETPQFIHYASAGFVLARTLGGVKIVLTPCAKDSGLAHIFAENSDKKTVLASLAFEAALTLFFLCKLSGIVTTAAYATLLTVWYMLHERVCRKIFGGITGDLAGFFICVSELIALACAAVGGLFL